MWRPEPTDYAEYYGLYVDQVPEGNILEILDRELVTTMGLLSGLPADWETFRYEARKWTLRQMVGHIVDTERLFSYRALSMARGESANLPGMDQNQWAEISNAESRPMDDLLADFSTARRSSIALYASFDEAMWDRHGTASDCNFGVRAFPYIQAGHEIHHRRVCEERYLKALRQRDA